MLLLIVIANAIGATISRRTFTQRSTRTRLQRDFALTMGTTEESYDLEAWKRGFSTCAKEICEKLPGTVPKDIKGTYYRNGYGKFESGKDKVMHPFDADGMMCAITIEDGNAIFRNRIIRTAGYVKEQKARRILYRGAFGTQRQGGALSNIFDVNIKNVANTNAMYWGNRLFALWEGGLPHRLGNMTVI
jgi:all-trans-8'-apo-beta-carotenal 15,15'-oxygenase